MGARIQITVPSVALTFNKTETRKALRQAANEVAALARALIRRTKQSLPGQPPANRTGLLASSIKVTKAQRGEGFVIRDTAQSARGSHAPYALFLEAGARGGTGKKGSRNVRARRGGKSILISVVGSRVLEPRPFLSTAADQRADSISTRVRAAVIDGIKFQRIKP